MKIAFIYPAKVAIAETKLQPDVFKIGDYEIAEVAGKIWFDTEKKKIKQQGDEINTYFLKHEETYIFLSCFVSRENFTLAFEKAGDKIHEMMRQSIYYVENPAEVEKEFQEKKAKQAAERAEMDREYEEREAQRAKNKELAFLKSMESFKGGGLVNWGTFEEICQRAAVKIGPKVMGWGRKNVVEISKENVRHYKGHKSESIWNVLQELSGKLV